MGYIVIDVPSYGVFSDWGSVLWRYIVIGVLSYGV